MLEISVIKRPCFNSMLSTDCAFVFATKEALPYLCIMMLVEMGASFPTECFFLECIFCAVAYRAGCCSKNSY